MSPTATGPEEVGTQSASKRSERGDPASREQEREDASSPSTPALATAPRDKSKKKKAPAVEVDDASGKAKHPNQYTYRQKERTGAGSNAAAFGLPSQSPSPSPSKHRLAATESSRKTLRGAVAEGSSAGSRAGTPAGDREVSASRLPNPGAPWGMPDHLAHLAYLLPTAQPEPLSLSLPTSKGAAPRSAASAAASNPTGANLGASPQPFGMATLLEPATKVRFPGKRMTLGEMRKRVRIIGEYVTRTQVEAVERGRRRRALGIIPKHLQQAQTQSQAAENDQEGSSARQEDSRKDGEGDTEMKGPPDEVSAGDNTETPSNVPSGATSSEADLQDEQAQGSKAPSPATTSASAVPPVDAQANTDPTQSDQTGQAVDKGRQPPQAPVDALPLSMRLLEDLTRELINFQRLYGVGVGANAGGIAATAAAAAAQGDARREAALVGAE